MALRKFATIFQCSIKKQPIAEPGEPDRTPPPRPCTRSQTKALANAAVRVPIGPHIRQTTTQLLDDPMHEEDISQDDVAHSPNHDIPRIVPIINNLRPKFPTKHEGTLEDPFPLIREAKAVTDPNTGKQLEYKQLINHPDNNLRRTWQHSSAK